ncbi:MAG: hypothetical protein VXY16_01585 [Pseudomonadota bacterium]|nr:hypothetical protein [Pseudomonadota bacterium]
MYRRLFSLMPAFVAVSMIGTAQADDSNIIDYSVEGSIRTVDDPDFATAFGRSLDYFGECDFNDNFSLMLMENNEAFLMGSVSISSFPYEAVLRPSEVYDRYVGGTLHLDLIFKAASDAQFYTPRDQKVDIPFKMPEGTGYVYFHVSEQNLGQQPDFRCRIPSPE